MSLCRSCSAEIRWARTAAGKPIPLDVRPTVTGNVVLAQEGDQTIAVTLAKAALEEARAEGRTLYMPHHASCKDGKAWKR